VCKSEEKVEQALELKRICAQRDEKEGLHQSIEQGPLPQARFGDDACCALLKHSWRCTMGSNCLQLKRGNTHTCTKPLALVMPTRMQQTVVVSTTHPSCLSSTPSHTSRTFSHTRTHTHIDTHARTYFPFTRPHLSTPCPPLFRRKAAAAPRRSARNQGVHKSVSYDNVQMTRMNKPSVLAVTLKLYLW